MASDPAGAAAAGAASGAAAGGPLGAAAGAVGGWVWGQYGKEWADKLLGEAKKRWEQFNWDKAAERYKESLRDQHATIRILGKSEPVPLEGLYTDVHVLDEITARSLYDIEELRKLGVDRSEWGRQKQKRHDGLKLIKRRGNFFILGKPGAGKTTFLRYITLQAISGLLNKVPIFLSLHAWSMRNEDALMPFIVRQFAICDFPDAQPFIEHLLGSGKAIVLFDGLDEVKLEGDRRRQLTLLLNDFAKEYRRTQVLITCRIAASEYQFDGFRDIEIADFTRDQIHAYSAKWFSEDTVKYEAFIAALYEERNQGLRELCANPLLLSMLCLAFDRTMRFPERRADLYEDALEALLEKWDTSRAIQRDKMYHQMSRQQKMRLLAAPAAEAFEEGHYFLEQRWLEQRIASYMKSLPGIPTDNEIDGGVILNAIEAQHGLLVERASDIYAYAHLSFQEYFTAKYIVDNATEGTVKRLIRSHLTDNRWGEVFLLTASMLANAKDFFVEMQQAIDRLVADNEDITKLLTWAATQKATQKMASVQPSLLRALYIYLAYWLNRVRALARDPDPDRARDPDFDFGHRRANFQAIAIARTIDPTIEVNGAITIDFDPTIARYLAIIRDLDLDPDRAPARGFNPDPNRALDLARAIEKTIPGISLERDELTSLIKDYLYATKLLVDCLQVAVVSNRKEIQDSLLLPPKQDKSE